MMFKKITVTTIIFFFSFLTVSAQDLKPSREAKAILRNSQTYAKKLMGDWRKTSQGKDPEHAVWLKHLQRELDAGKVPGPKEMSSGIGWLSNIANNSSWLSEINKGLKTSKDALILIENSRRRKAKVSAENKARSTNSKKSKRGKN